MSSADTFLEAILSDPDNDELRLIYADWLEERGDPRGEFIRVQFELAATRDALRQSRLAAREQELLALHGEEWGRPFHAMGASPVYRHGFVEGLRLDAAAFLENAETIFRLAPVCRVQFRVTEDELPPLLRSRFLSRLHGLDLHANYLGDLGAHHLAECVHLGGLKELILSHCNFNLDGARAVANAPHLGHLTHLDLSGNDIGYLGMYALATSSRLPRLAFLELASCGMALDGLRALAGSPEFARFELLDLSGNALGNLGLSHLLSPRLKALHVLRLNNCQITTLGIPKLAASPHVGGLTELHLSANHISSGGVIALAESPHLKGLTDLYLMGNPIPAEEKPALRQRFRCTVHF